MLDRQEWRDTMRTGHGLNSEYYTWFARNHRAPAEPEGVRQPAADARPKATGLTYDQGQPPPTPGQADNRPPLVKLSANGQLSITALLAAYADALIVGDGKCWLAATLPRRKTS